MEMLRTRAEVEVRVSCMTLVGVEESCMKLAEVLVNCTKAEARVHYMALAGVEVMCTVAEVLQLQLHLHSRIHSLARGSAEAVLDSSASGGSLPVDTELLLADIG